MRDVQFKKVPLQYTVYPSRIIYIGVRLYKF